MPKAPDQMDNLAAVAAHLLANRLPRSEVGQELSLRHNNGKPYSRAYVSKIINRAIDNKWIESKFILHIENMPLHLRALIGSVNIIEQEIKVKFPTLNNIRIIDFVTNKNDIDAKGIDNILEALPSILHPPRVLGVAGGVTMHNLVHEIDRKKRENQDFYSSFLSSNELKIFPAAAILENQDNNLSSTAIAKSLARAVTPNYADAVPSLTGLFSFLDIDADVLSAYRQGHPDYVAIFGNETERSNSSKNRNCYVNRMDTFITSVSSEFGLKKNKKEKRVEYCDRLEVLERKGTIGVHSSQYLGDIAGALILRDLKSGLEADKTALDKYYKYSNSINYNQIKRLYIRAKKEKDSINGVVVVADTSEKAGVVRKLLARGLINTLICDNSLAQTLLRMDSPRKRKTNN